MLVKPKGKLRWITLIFLVGIGIVLSHGQRDIVPLAPPQEYVEAPGLIELYYPKAEVVSLGTYFVVYETADGEKIERFQNSTLDAVRQFLDRGFVGMVWDGTDCNSCIDVSPGIRGCTSMFCPNYVPDRPKPKNPKLIGVFRGQNIPFTTETVEKKVVIEPETIYHMGEEK